MGLDADIIVDDCTIDVGSWSNIIDPTIKKTINVSYIIYDEGYGDYELYVYIKNILSGNVEEIIHDDETILTINLEKYGSDKLEIYICLKGDCFSNAGPFFKTDPPKWFDKTLKKIRDDPIFYLKQLKEKEDIYKFIKSFVLIKNGEYVCETPIFKKSDFTNRELDSFKHLLKIWVLPPYSYTRPNYPPIIIFSNQFMANLTKMIE
jgi:hypothetical protein